MSERHELYRSPNGDFWHLGRDPETGYAFVIHRPNEPSGGRLSDIELGEFLSAETQGPQHQALLRLIGTLVDGPHNSAKCIREETVDTKATTAVDISVDSEAPPSSGVQMRANRDHCNGVATLPDA